MSDVVDIDAARCARIKAKGTPGREADMVLEAWIEGGEVKLLAVSWQPMYQYPKASQADRHRKHVDLLADALFTFGAGCLEPGREDARAVMVAVFNEDGTGIRKFNRSLFHTPSRTWARWFLACGAHDFRWWAKSAWRALWGKG